MPETIDLTSETDSAPNSRAGSEQPLGDIAHTQLHVAINTVPEQRLREIIAGLVDSVPAVARAIFNKLVVAVDNESDQEPEQDQHVQEYVPRWEVCVNCDKEFDAGEEREDGECVYHTGDLEAIEELFPDHDEDVHGPTDTPENRRAFPERFSWTCCDKDGTDEGCEEGTHEPGGMLRKRRKRH